MIRPLREWYNGSIGSIFSYDQLKEELLQLNVNPEDARHLLNLEEQVSQLMLVEYRYIRLAFHPVLHKFLVIG